MARKQTPREHAKDITEGREEPHHIGPLTGAALQMEWWSLANTKPAFHDDKWKKRLETVKSQTPKELLNGFERKYRLS